MFSGKLAPLVTGFAKKNELNKDDITALKALISDWEKNND
jgi:predicted transcriptional regulator